MMKRFSDIFSSKKTIASAAIILAGTLIVASAAILLIDSLPSGDPSASLSGIGSGAVSGEASSDLPVSGSASQPGSTDGSGDSQAQSPDESAASESAAASGTSGVSSSSSSDSTASAPVTSDSLVTWNPPSGTVQNNSYSVYVKKSGTEQWHSLFVYNVKIGHQEGNDPLRALVGMSYNGPIDTSMVNFDFTGKADFKIVYQKSSLDTVDISPLSYNIKYTKDKNTIYFTLEQKDGAPRKFIVRANGDWDKNVLHVMTNAPDRKIPSRTAGNVYVIKAGDEIPRVLPEGKDTYYFDNGVHVLPRGAWAEFDIGRVAEIGSFDFVSGGERPFLVPGAQSFRIEYKEKAADKYRTCYETSGNTALNLYGQSFNAVKARYIRIVLLGNTAVKTGSGYNYLNSNHLKEFRIFEKGTSDDLILNKAVDGSSANYPMICDGSDDNNSYYGHIYSSESFFLARDNYKVYIAPGAIVKGAINSDWRSGIRITGRGILDCSTLIHDPAGRYAEGRTSAIRSEYSDNMLIEGITVLDSPMWGIITNHSDGPVVRGINFFGSIVNSDGVHMSAVTNGLVEGCFIRTTDDLFVMYHYGPADTVLVRNSVFFSDGARIVLIGMANSPGDISNVTFDNNDILNVQNVWDLYKHGGAFSIWASGGNTVSDIVFSNVRIEAFREPRIASLFQIKTIDESGWGSGKVDGVTFRNITYGGSGEALSYLLGDGPDNTVENIRFQNFVYNGQVLTASYHPNIEIKAYVDAVTFAK
ncbi:MAG: glycosyl hydrolase family 28 protein [Saccharofermentanales bacterium]